MKWPGLGTGGKASSSSGNLRRLALDEEPQTAPATPRRAAASSDGGARGDNPMRRRSLPAMHVGADDAGSLAASCAMLLHPPTWDNPLRRRGCADHIHLRALSEYRAPAIERELQTKALCAAASAPAPEGDTTAPL
ncbi:hypothetical protein HT031_001109 [Scenedesmus sp. PABB004]|nr:hypothetical protein HT031_001109 [Scenedesmus sp. PABB004]